MKDNWKECNTALPKVAHATIPYIVRQVKHSRTYASNMEIHWTEYSRK